MLLHKFPKVNVYNVLYNVPKVNVQQTKHLSAYIQVWLYLGLMQFSIQNKFETCSQDLTNNGN